MVPVAFFVNVAGKLSDERFEQLSKGYDYEQDKLKMLITELVMFIETTEQKAADTTEFIKAVKEYEHITEFTPELRLHRTKLVRKQRSQVFVGLYRNSADRLPSVKGFLCNSTENMQADFVQSCQGVCGAALKRELIEKSLFMPPTSQADTVNRKLKFISDLRLHRTKLVRKQRSQVFVGLYRNSAGRLPSVKGFLCNSTENMQADFVQSCQGGVRCCPKARAD